MASFNFASANSNKIKCHVARDPESFVIYSFKKDRDFETLIDTIKVADNGDGSLWGQARCDGVIGYINMKYLDPTYSVIQFPMEGCRERPPSEQPEFPIYTDEYSRFGALQSANPDLAQKIIDLMGERDENTKIVQQLIGEIRDHTILQTTRTVSQIQQTLYEPTSTAVQTLSEDSASIYESSVIGIPSPLLDLIENQLKEVTSAVSNGEQIVQDALNFALENQEELETPDIMRYFDDMASYIGEVVIEAIEPVKAGIADGIESLVQALEDPLTELNSQLTVASTQLGSAEGDGTIPILSVKISNFMLQTLGSNIFNDTSFLDQYVMDVYNFDFINNVSDAFVGAQQAVESAKDLLMTQARSIKENAVKIMNQVINTVRAETRYLLDDSFQENTNGLQVFDEQVRDNIIKAFGVIIERQVQVGTNQVSEDLVAESFIKTNLTSLLGKIQTTLNTAMSEAAAKIDEELQGAANDVNGKMTHEVELAAAIDNENPTKIAQEIVSILYDEDITRVPSENGEGELMPVRLWSDAQILVAGYAAALAADKEMEFGEGQKGDYIFDAIGFVSYAYQKAISRPLPTSYEDLSLAGQSIVEDMSTLRAGDISVLMPGDILLFAKQPYESQDTMVLDHAAIYIGHGLMAHAQSPVAGLQYQTHVDEIQWLQRLEFIIRFNQGNDGNFTDVEGEDEEDIAIEVEEMEPENPDEPIVDPVDPVDPDGEEEEGECHSCQLVNAATLINLGWSNVNSHMVAELNEALQEFAISGEAIWHFLAHAAVASEYGLWPIEPQSGLEHADDTTLGNADENECMLYKGAGYLRLRGRTAYEAFQTYLGTDNLLVDGAAAVGTQYAWKAAGFAWSYAWQQAGTSFAESMTVEEVTVVLYGDSSNTATVQEAFNAAESAVNTITPVPATSPLDYERVISPSMLAALGWTQQTTLEKQLAETINVYGLDTPQKLQHFIAQASWVSQNGTTPIGSMEDAGSSFMDIPAGYIRMVGQDLYTAFQEEIGDPMIGSQGAFYVAQNYPWRASGFVWASSNAGDSAIGGAESLADVCAALNGEGADCSEVLPSFYLAERIIQSTEPFYEEDPRAPDQIVSISELIASGWLNTSRGLAHQLNEVLNTRGYNTVADACKFIAIASHVSNGGSNPGSYSSAAEDKWNNAGYIPIAGETEFEKLATDTNDNYITQLGAPYVTERYPWMATAQAWDSLGLETAVTFDDVATILYADYVPIETEEEEDTFITQQVAAMELVYELCTAAKQ